MKNAVLFLTVASISFFGTGVAFAAGEDGNLLDLARPVFDAVMSGHYAYAAALALVLAVALARRYGAKQWPWLAGDVGGTLLVLVGSFGGAAATALTGGAAVSLGLVWTSIQVAAGASGGYTMIKRLVIPTLAKLVSKLPPLFQKPFKLILWMFEGNAAKAGAAGQAAVAANPASGLEGLAGKSKDVP